jgi:hypothetical protein
MGEGGGCGSPSGADIACIPSIFIKASQLFFGESCLMSAFTKFFFEKLRMIGALGGAERGHPVFRRRILAKKVCSQKITIKEKRRRFVRSFTKKNSEGFDENRRNGGCFSKFGPFCTTCIFDFSPT